MLTTVNILNIKTWRVYKMAVHISYVDDFPDDPSKNYKTNYESKFEDLKYTERNKLNENKDEFNRIIDVIKEEFPSLRSNDYDIVSLCRFTTSPDYIVKGTGAIYHITYTHYHKKNQGNETLDSINCFKGSDKGYHISGTKVKFYCVGYFRPDPSEKNIKAFFDDFNNQPDNDLVIILKHKGKDRDFDFIHYKGNDIPNKLSDIYHSLGNKSPESVEEDIVQKSIAENRIFYGVPGCGKSYYIKDEYIPNYIDKEKAGQIERVVFHPDYTYSDFVGQILPTIKETKDPSGKVTKSEVVYKFIPGPFTRILKKAIDGYKDWLEAIKYLRGIIEKPDKEGDATEEKTEYFINTIKSNSYYLIIEEINRGNAPAIFGDIFQLLDRKDEDVAGESEYQITNEDIANVIYEKIKVPKKEKKSKIGDAKKNNKVFIPGNLFLVGTMNTSDQNVFTLDTAFQRRWNMKLISNEWDGSDDDEKLMKTEIDVVGKTIKWGDFRDKINEIIADSSFEFSNEDKRLGKYFVKKADLEDRKAFAEKVLKYLWDDAFKMNRDNAFVAEIEYSGSNVKINSLEILINMFEKKGLEVFKVKFK